MPFNFVVSNKIRTFATKSKYMEKELFRTIITYEDEGEIERDGLRIEIRPAWKVSSTVLNTQLFACFVNF